MLKFHSDKPCPHLDFRPDPRVQEISDADFYLQTAQLYPQQTGNNAAPSPKYRPRKVLISLCFHL